MHILLLMLLEKKFDTKVNLYIEFARNSTFFDSFYNFSQNEICPQPLERGYRSILQLQWLESEICDYFMALYRDSSVPIIKAKTIKTNEDYLLLGDYVQMPVDNLIQYHTPGSRQGRYYDPMKQGLFRQAFTWMPFNDVAIHLLSRHHNKLTTRTSGYWAPLTMTCWVYFIVAIGIILRLLTRNYGERYYMYHSNY